ncbi:MAG: dipeptide epimerase [Lewinellaceae bacterium]|nr:dipeptide epimerase [Saprospiraceae bacterium]MCB9337851.1 dipeptide epimerase [Lewinellaceae bacterium]
MKLRLHTTTLTLKEPFTISRGTYTERKALIVELSIGNKSGFGEASEHAYYGVDIETLVAKATSLRPLIESYALDNPENFWEFLNLHLQGFSFLQCAIDNAAHDLYGKICGQPCHRLWGLEQTVLPKTSYTLTIDSVDKMVEKVKSHNFDIYKVKLGVPNDMDILKILRKHTDATLRVDANCAWTVEETIRNSFIMNELGVEFMEQPLKADDWEGMKEVFQKSALPAVADEACQGEADIEKCANSFDGINIKLMKCGGLTPALRMIRLARFSKLKVMCGCMVESTIGISAIAQLLPLLDYVDMDGPLLISNDPAAGARILADGTVEVPDGPGLGITMY